MEHAASTRIPCRAPEKRRDVIKYVKDTLLPAMIDLAEEDYRNGSSADCTVDIESLRSRRQELIEYCRAHGLKLPEECRDQSGNAPVGDWLVLVMTHMASSDTITIHSFEEGMDNVPYIRLTLS